MKDSLLLQILNIYQGIFLDPTLRIPAQPVVYITIKV